MRWLIVYHIQLSDVQWRVYKTLGPGLLESVYEKALLLELRSEGFNMKSQVPIEVFYKGKSLGEGFRLDILVEDSLIVEGEFYKLK